MRKLLTVILLIFLTSLIVSGEEGGSASNLELNIPLSYQQSHPGEEIIFTLNFLHFDNAGRRDVTMFYEIRDYGDNIVSSKSETFAVETQASFVGRMPLPVDMKVGKYYLRVYMKDANISTIEARSSFEVNSKSYLNNSQVVGIAFIILFLTISSIFILKGKSILANYRIRSRVKKIVRERMQHNKDEK